MKVLGRMLTVALAVFVCRQSSADGANLFATIWSEGKQIDAERALSPISVSGSPSRAASGDPRVAHSFRTGGRVLASRSP